MFSASKHSRAILTLLLFTAVIRGGVLWAMRRNLEQDPDGYREIAENLIRHGEFALGGRESYGMVSDYRPKAYRPPLYPVVLSNLPTADGQSLSLVKVAGLHVLLGVGTVWLTWLTARRVGPASIACAGPPVIASADGGPAPAAGWSHPTMALVAGLLVAMDPILLNQQTLVMTETLAAFLAILSLWCLARFDAKRGWFEAGLAGGAMGLAILCRPTFLPWLGLVTFAYLGLGIGEWGFGRLRRAQERNRWGAFWRYVINVSVLITMAAVFIAPWAIRNERRFGKPIATTTHGGYTLLLGNNESFYEWLRSDTSGVPWSADSYFTNAAGVLSNMNMVIGTRRFPTAEVSEINIDRGCYEIAWKAIADHPGDFVRACLYRIVQLWSPLPHQLSADESNVRRFMRYATCLWYCGVFLLASVGVWKVKAVLWRPPWVWGVLMCVAFTAVHTFYWTNLRMRAPLMPFVAIVAAVGVRSFLRGWNKNERHVRDNGELPGG